MWRRNNLSTENIQHYLEIPSGSEDEKELSGEDSDDDLIRVQDLVMNELDMCPEILQDDYLFENVSIPSPQSSSSMLVTSNSANVTPQPSTSSQANRRSRRVTSRAQPTPIPAFVPPTAQPFKPKPNKREYIWRKMEFHQPDTTFTRDEVFLFRIRPLLETLRKKCQAIPKRETLSVDEQMCATKASNFLRQYVPNKPHKWGYKLLVLCDDKGFAYAFEIYSGTAQNDPELRLADEPDLGASANIVVRLCRSVPKNQNYKVFFDNYYTSPELISYLTKMGLHALGTVNRSRLGNSLKMSTQKELTADKKLRGYSEGWVATVDAVPVSAVFWLDSKPVVLASSFVGEQPKYKVKRFCKKRKQYIVVEAPNIIGHYNRHMGGVDLLDSFIRKHKIKMRTRKWYMRLFYHLLDVILINSWLLFKRVEMQRQNITKMKLRQFRLEVAKSLCLCGSSMRKRKGRPSSFVTVMLDGRKKKKPKATVPPKDVRIDGVEHFPIWSNARQRCKLPACKGKSFVTCQKCNVALCINKDKNCFLPFHE